MYEYIYILLVVVVVYGRIDMLQFLWKRRLSLEEDVIVYMPDIDCVPFVAKMQKAKTRKNKDYFVLRATIPKDVTKKIGVKPGEYLFFKAKKAQWYHMLDWQKMGNTWKMLPDNVRNEIILGGLCQETVSGITMANVATAPGAINLPALAQPLVNVPDMSKW